MPSESQVNAILASLRLRSGQLLFRNRRICPSESSLHV